MVIEFTGVKPRDTEGRPYLIIKMLSVEGMFSFLRLMVQLLLLTLPDIKCHFPCYLEFCWDRARSLCLRVSALALCPPPCTC